MCVQVAKEYCEQLGVDACIKLFEQFRSYEGLYFFSRMKVIRTVYIDWLILLLFTHDVRMQDMIIERKNVISIEL